MTETFVVRFTETERYNINIDDMVTRFTAIASNGSWSCETKLRGASDLRKKRNAFKQYVLQSLALHEDPIEFDEESLEELVREVEMG